MDESEMPAEELGGELRASDLAEGAPADQTFPDVADAPLLEVPATEVASEPDLLLQMTQFVDAGGPVVVILLVMSIVALAIILLKLWQFARLGIGSNGRARAAAALYREGRTEEALARLGSQRNPAARLLALAIGGRQRADLSEAGLREELARLGSDQVESLRGGLRALEVIGGLAPLLGLFGTVLGMIAAFQAMEQAGNQVDPSILSGGIWEALLTTAVGLAVAIPAVAVHNWLERRIERQAQEMESLVTQVFTADLTRPAPQATAQAAPHDAQATRLRLHAAGE